MYGGDGWSDVTYEGKKSEKSVRATIKDFKLWVLKDRVQADFFLQNQNFQIPHGGKILNSNILAIILYQPKQIYLIPNYVCVAMFVSQKMMIKN